MITLLLAIALVVVWLLGALVVRLYLEEARRFEPAWAILTWPVWFAIALCKALWIKSMGASAWPR